VPCVDNDVALLYQETWGTSFFGLVSGLLFAAQPLCGLWFLKVQCSDRAAGAFVASSTATALLSLLNAAVWHGEAAKVAALEAYERGGHNVVANQTLHATCGALYALAALNTVAGCFNVLLLVHGREHFSHFDGRSSSSSLASSVAGSPYQRAAQDAQHRPAPREWAAHGAAPLAASFRKGAYEPPELAPSYQASGEARLGAGGGAASFGGGARGGGRLPERRLERQGGDGRSERPRRQRSRSRPAGGEAGSGSAAGAPRGRGEGEDTALRRRTPSFHAADGLGPPACPGPPAFPSGGAPPRAAACTAAPAVYTAAGDLESGREEDDGDEAAEAWPLLGEGAAGEGTTDGEAIDEDGERELDMN
jgi:hypothetical protein